MILRQEPSTNGRGLEWTVEKTPNGAIIKSRVYDLCGYVSPWTIQGHFINTTVAIGALMDFINNATEVYKLI